MEIRTLKALEWLHLQYYLEEKLMAKINRFNGLLPIFSNNEKSKLTIFGSGIDATNPGTPATTPEDIVKSTSQWLKGWIFQNPQIGDVPIREDFNNINFVFNYVISYLLQQGIPEWNSAQEYFTNSYVVYSGNIYKSLQGTDATPNVNKIPDTEITYWKNILSDFVTLTGNQTISGLKTFNSYPRIALQSGNVPVPSVNNDLVSKKYVDDKFQQGNDYITDTFISADSSIWYRKYNSGWIEQGGLYDYGANVRDLYAVITFPVAFANLNYTLLVTSSRAGDGNRVMGVGVTKETTYIKVNAYGNHDSDSARYLNYFAVGRFLS
jgi:hypothetical protein